MKKFFILYLASPKMMLYHIGCFLCSMFFVSLYAVLVTGILEIPVGWLLNDFAELNVDEQTLRILIACAASFWPGVYLSSSKPYLFTNLMRP